MILFRGGQIFQIQAEIAERAQNQVSLASGHEREGVAKGICRVCLVAKRLSKASRTQPSLRPLGFARRCVRVADESFFWLTCSLLQRGQADECRICLGAGALRFRGKLAEKFVQRTISLQHEFGEALDRHGFPRLFHQESTVAFDEDVPVDHIVSVGRRRSACW